MSFLVQISLQNIHFRSLACTCLSRKRLQTWWEDRAPNLWWQARLCGVGSPWWWGGNPPFYAECKCSASWGSQKKGCCCCGCDWHGQMQLKKVKVGGWSCPFKQHLQPEAPPNCVRSNSTRQDGFVNIQGRDCRLLGDLNYLPKTHRRNDSCLSTCLGCTIQKKRKQHESTIIHLSFNSNPGTLVGTN